MDKIQLNKTVSTVGELKKLLSPFRDECRITPQNIYYIPMSDGSGARLLFEKEPSKTVEDLSHTISFNDEWQDQQ